MATAVSEVASRLFPPEGLVLEFGDDTVSYADLVVVAMLCDEWKSFLEMSALGSHLAASRQPDKAALRLEAERFRRGRRLEAAEDLRAWLATRSLSQPEWRSSLERIVLVQSCETPPASESPASESPPAALPDVLIVDAFCRSLWEETCRLAVSWLAAFHTGEGDGGVREHRVDLEEVAQLAVGIDVPASRVEVIASWQGAFDSVRRSLASDDAVERLVRRKDLDWTSFDFDELTVDSKEAALEAYLCSRDDELEPEEIVLRSGGELTSRSERAESLSATFAADLLAAPIGGGAVGPSETSDGWSITWLKGRRRPDAEDPDIRASATAELLEEFLDRHSAGQVRWIGPV